MQRPLLSIVIPTLNGAERLPACLAALRLAGSVENEQGFRLEVVVADGGSSDGSLALASSLGCQTAVAPPGRGRQLEIGAARARGDWLLFLHDDTRLSETWPEAVRSFISEPGNLSRAGYFLLTFDEPSPQASRVAGLANWRARVLGLPYGDQGLLISRAFYEELGGFPAHPLMEDVALVRRIGRRRLRILDARAVTSAERYRRDGWWARPLRNLGLLALYYLGVSPQWLARRYR